MGVYIKDMKLPRSCWDCEVGGAKQMDNATCPFYSMEYWEQENYQDKIADGCPLVPVPPHGDLIDRNELKENCMKEDSFLAELLFRKVSNAPTIIPAEEGET